jgi:hypothetical protein
MASKVDRDLAVERESVVRPMAEDGKLTGDQVRQPWSN